MKQKAATTLLVIFALLLALDIAMRVSPRDAAAQEPEIGIFPEPPEELFFYTGLVQASNTITTVYRLRSDGVVEFRSLGSVGVNSRWASGSAWAEIPEAP